ncbi:hypothetical protein PV08_08674 [Exophiala spinifera]|uniref:non-specific serine/threonine protein kinase n=1 Tax=Exophiala spinifera TaxID=91928 RepID=A0A0D1YEK3_9EURO|nr:uncharacterized protein PV08_08674 [Exophiala spinifera]KIW13486.1 hypothetical protein PV08_08674 [Exophiala spinifera]
MTMISLYSEAAPHRSAASQAPFEIQDDDADGETLADRFQMLEELGSGSFGVVYKAIEKATGEIVAIKHVDLESSEEDLSDILSELSVLSSCSSSHVTKYRLAFLRRQTLWIVMEYLGGGSCADLLKPPPHRLSENHIAIVCRELLLGLAYLHSEGKLHRDIKAANVLLGMDGRVKLADFGVAAQLVGLKSVRNTFVGTPFWMAPEVIQQEGHDAKADVWSLGITAMELANGEPPHANVHPMKVLFLIPKQPAPRLEGGSWSRDFRDFVACCLTKDVDRRPTAKELLKHRFIRSAGKIEGLQELIVRKQDWESQKGGERSLKYYAETLKNLSGAKEDDDWVFETVKAVPTMDSRRPMPFQTQKRRKVSSTVPDVVAEENTPKMVEQMTLDEQQSPTKVTMRRIPSTQPERRPSADYTATTARRTTRKRLSSHIQARQPLGVNMNFGNSPSTVRQFKRVSSNPSSLSDLQDGTGEGDENDDPTSSVVRTPSKKPGLGMLLGVDVQKSLLGEDERIEEPMQRLRIGSNASVIAAQSKEAQLGRKLYAYAIGISCQDVLNETADEVKREGIARLAEAFSDLESLDPDGMYHIMRGVMDRMARDETLKSLIPSVLPQPQPQPVLRQESGGSRRQKDGDKEHVSKQMLQTSPRKASDAIQANESRQVTPSTPRAQAQKLVLAQNNPHLKSHRRRQSAQVAARSRETSQGLFVPPSPLKNAARLEREQDDDNEREMMNGLVGGLEHTRQLADVLFERWCEGLRVRWPAV